ncbi:phosphatidylinositol mannoside acyltransferase [Egibacter rhizosphaerae]|uniref:Phosphatidylinositol mannoside acyltransferase n=1 Tax=Egibacter rhizosphaerae TaxID=1670831 RepID=A0A411YJT3_9ACTN|nr:phosphatidylinositol mannoside acyltransferase [Egibacter rhizosphaerae]QBI21458.1 phosphatidylinositol mannoside acyltransferase [Egibacter rhizosphaerae]
MTDVARGHGPRRHDRERYRGSGWRYTPVDRRPGAIDRVPAGGGRRDRVGERLMGRLWLAAWTMLRVMPESIAFGLAEGAGALLRHLSPPLRRRVTANLGRVVAPEQREEVVARAFRSYGRYWAESFRAADLDPGELDRRTTTAGFEHLDAALDRGRGVIVLLAHHGSWDIAARWAESHRYHLAVVAEVVRPRALFARFVALREAMGLEVVPLRPRAPGGRAGVTERLLEALEANHLVGLLADRDLSGRAPRVRLFGEPAPLPPGPAALARQSGAPIVPITMLQRPGRSWHLQVLPAIDVAHLGVTEGQRAVAVGLEALVGLDPDQWHAFQPIWDQPDHRDGGRARAGGSGARTSAVRADRSARP